jgi:hypothetical protein
MGVSVETERVVRASPSPALLIAVRRGREIRIGSNNLLVGGLSSLKLTGCCGANILSTSGRSS